MGGYLKLPWLLEIMHFFSCKSTEEPNLETKMLNISPILYTMQGANSMGTKQ